MNIAVCDDDRLFLKQAETAVREWAQKQNAQIGIGTFENGDALLNALHAEQFDILLLDIMMPLFNGMELAHTIRRTDRTTKIIFLTSSPEFAVESYDVKASGYLLKPLQPAKLCRLLDELAQDSQEEPQHVIIRTTRGYHKLYLHDIECLEAQNKKVLFHLTGGKTKEALGTFSNYAESLETENGFFKCHRSYLVSLSQVDYFNSSEIRMQSGLPIPIARSYSRDFKDAYFAYMFQEGDRP